MTIDAQGRQSITPPATSPRPMADCHLRVAPEAHDPKQLS